MTTAVPSDGWRPTVRDKVAWAICQAALKFVASSGYRKRIEGSIRLGMITAVEHTLQGRD
jgi:hypothetical protein